jgi:hypothetical protein
MKMFYCIGENQFDNMALGVGPSIELAIIDWAGTDNHYAEFEDYKPIIIEGNLINVKLQTHKTITHNFVVK